MMMSTLKSLQLVTGNWKFYHSDSDTKVIFPFTDRVDIGKSFFSSNFLVVCSLLAMALIWIVLLTVSAWNKP